jgi:hypothetical protein
LLPVEVVEVMPEVALAVIAPHLVLKVEAEH